MTTYWLYCCANKNPPPMKDRLPEEISAADNVWADASALLTVIATPEPT